MTIKISCFKFYFVLLFFILGIIIIRHKQQFCKFDVYERKRIATWFESAERFLVYKTHLAALLVDDVPLGAEDVERLAEAVVVDEARVETEGSHQQDDVATREDHAEHLSTAQADTPSVS